MSADTPPFRLQDFARAEILAMKGYLPGEQPQGGKFIKLNTNENPYPPSPKVMAAIADLGPNLRKYPDPSATAFRHQVGNLFSISPEQVLCGNGSDEILSLVCRLFLEPGRTVRWASPTYLMYETLAQACGATPDTVRYNRDWSLPEEFYSGQPALVFIANPNSPSGTCLSTEELSKIIGRFQCPVVVDEAYADFAGTSAIELLPKHPNLIVSRTLSKSYALAGLRFGYAVTSTEIVAQLHKLRDSYNCDMLSVAMATAALEDQKWLQENVTTICEERQRLAQALENLGLSVQPSQANFLWCQHVSIPAETFYAELKKRHILVRMMDYGDPFVGIRITVGTPEQNQVLLQQLEQVLNS